MDRRLFITGGAVLAGGIVVGLSGRGGTAALDAALAALAERLGQVPGGTPPDNIGEPEIEAICRLADHYETEAMRLGGDGAAGSTLYADGLAAIKLTQMSLGARCPETLRPKLHAAAAWLFRAVGFMAFDLGRRTIAEDILWAAHELAGDSGNVSLEARIVGTRARQDAWEGDPMRAAALVSGMLERGRDRLTPTEVAMLHGVHARALARIGREQAVYRAVGEADEAFGASQSVRDTTDRPWVRFWDFPHEQGETGRALLDLAVLLPGRQRQAALTNAAARNRQSIATYDVNGKRRPAAFTVANQAYTYLALGHPDEALHLGRQAIGLQAGLTSRRMSDHLRMVRQGCGDFCGGNADAAELSETIGQVLVEADA